MMLQYSQINEVESYYADGLRVGSRELQHEVGHYNSKLRENFHQLNLYESYIEYFCRAFITLVVTNNGNCTESKIECSKFIREALEF